MAAGSDSTDREILITRTFDAPPAMVWRAWTDPKQIVRWWGPNGFTTTTHVMEVRPGGEWRFDMHGPDGRNYPNRIVFREVVEDQRLAYDHRGDADVEPVTFTVTVTFDKQDDKTKLTLRMVFPSTAERDRVIREYGAVDGGVQTVDRLGDHLGGQRAVLTIALPSDRQIIMNRRFDAPRRLVWEAMTRPELLQRWMFTPPGWTWAECTMDVRVGGKFRWTWNGPDGRLGLSIWGEHREVNPPTRIVHTERMEMGPGAGECGPGAECAEPWELLATIELDERDEKTHLKMTLLFPNREGRDGALASGMEHGVAAGYDQLDGLLAGEAC